MAQVIRPLAMVRLKSEWETAEDLRLLPFANDLPLIYLGEIPNMPEHGIFIGYSSGRAYSGYHIERFEEIPSEDL